MRVFVDTNVWVAAFVARGTCAELVEHLVAHHTILTSETVATELERVLADKFDYSPTRVEQVLGWLGRVAESEPSPEDPSEVTADRDDDYVLQSAVDAEADCLVTGDSDLLRVENHRGVAILEPADFWRIG